MTHILNTDRGGWLNLGKLNSMTKYPSIPTYHTLGQRGMLTDEFIPLPEGRVIATEKVDGTNARIIWLPTNGYIIGSREELLTASGDVIYNRMLEIVSVLRCSAELLVTDREYYASDPIWVFYFEVFGGKGQGTPKNYGKGEVSFRLFDIMRLDDYPAIHAMNRDQISLWREERQGQPFLPEEELQAVAKEWGFALTPRIYIDKVPTDHAEVLDWLRDVVPETQCKLNEHGTGRAEGVVVRTLDRSVIAKIRYEDYERHARRLAESK